MVWLLSIVRKVGRSILFTKIDIFYLFIVISVV